MNVDPHNLLEELKKYRVHIFNYHSEYLLNKYLNPLVLSIKKSGFSPLNRFKNKSLAILIEDRVTNVVRFCILNTLIMSRFETRIRVYTTSKSYKLMKSLIFDISDWVEIIELDNNNYRIIDKISYNKLLTGKEFWEELPAKNILIIQTDSLLIEPFDDELFKYDYIGAPFAKGKIKQTEFPTFSKDLKREIGTYWFSQQLNYDDDVKAPIGNGGLSIRNKDLMLKIIKNETPNSNENEDIFFSNYLEKYNAKIPTLEIARRFACEGLYYSSIGSHASHIYLSGEEQAKIYERHFKYLLSLISSFQKYFNS